MDLLAISYFNIGPFKDKILNIFFDKGKFLIRAPIGSGKSFLFFDWPTYALYKHTGRNVLNVDSKDGYIKLLFEVEWQKYLVIRNLAQWKSKDTCKSQLFIVNWDVNFLWEMENTFKRSENNNSQDIQDLLKTNWVKLDEIGFKNERDLDGNLSEFLPPREVFLSTVFLLQDSENVFELQPVDRLIVMKNIFNLIWIDEIKEQISNKRREIQTTLKVKSDTSNFDSKIKTILGNYIDSFNNIISMDCFTPRNDGINNNPDTVIASLRSNLLKYQEFIQELEIIADKVNINEFSIEWFDKDFHKSISSYISEEKLKYQEVLVKLQHTESQIKEKNENIRKLNIENDKIKLNIEGLNSKINQIDPQKIENKKKEKLNLIWKSDAIINWINLDINIPKELTDIVQNEPNNLDEFNIMITNVIAKWQNFADQKTIIDSKIENEKIKAQSEIKNLEIEIKNLETNIVNLNEQWTNLENKIKNLDTTINDESQFECVKINSNCPFIKDINKKTFEELGKQRDSFVNEKEVINNKISAIQKGLEEKNNIKSSLSVAWNTNDEIKKMELEKNNIEKTILSLRKFLAEIDFKSIQSIYQERRDLNSQISIIDKEILQLELWAQELENYKNEKIKLSQQIEHIKIDKDKIKDELVKLWEALEWQKILVNKFDINKLKNIEKINQNMMENVRDIENLIQEFKNSQLALSKLKQDEKIVKDLYQIFSKELLLFVLEWYLPILTDIINSFLAQVVEYSIDIKLVQKRDNLEMDVKVYDEKWERDIKSLSGWQKVILKLVWMLAISSYMKSPILFLDETINNLDNDTVWKVADMLSNFVKQRNVKLYTVTHSHQIQQMDIWDKVIHIEDII